MTIRPILCGVVCLSLLGASSIASAGGWHHAITRKLGIWYGDGYHAREGCPSEKPRGGHAPGWSGYAGDYGYSEDRGEASAFADQHRSYAPRTIYGGPMHDGPVYGGEIDDVPHFGETLPGELTPARPKATLMPTAPNDPSVPMLQGHSEARLPSSMFPLTPLR